MSVFFTFWLWNVCSCVFAKFYKKITKKNWETNSCVDTTETFNVFERLLLILLTKVTTYNNNNYIFVYYLVPGRDSSFTRGHTFE